MFLVVLKKKIFFEFIYCRRLNSQYYGAPKSEDPKMLGLPAVAGIAGGSYATDHTYSRSMVVIFRICSILIRLT